MNLLRGSIKNIAYKIIVSVRTQKEIENTIDYYVRHGYDAPKKFIEA